jgi:hypothetical protein
MWHHTVQWELCGVLEEHVACILRVKPGNRLLATYTISCQLLACFFNPEDGDSTFFPIELLSDYTIYSNVYRAYSYLTNLDYRKNTVLVNIIEATSCALNYHILLDKKWQKVMKQWNSVI